MSVSNNLFISIVLLISMPVAAQTKELLKDVDPTKARKISTYSETFLGENTYFSKRHRIVEVNSDLLFGGEQFSITPFGDNVAIVVQRDSLTEGSNPETAVWHGTVVSPYVDMSDLNLPEEELEKIAGLGLSNAQFLNALFRIRLFSINWDVDRQTGNAYPSYGRKEGGLSPEPVEDAKVPELHKNAFRSVSGDLDLSIFGLGKYRLRPLQFLPKYHVIYEVDPLKVFSYPEDDSDLSIRAQEQRKKARNYENHVKILPSKENKVIKGDIQ